MLGQIVESPKLFNNRKLFAKEAGRLTVFTKFAKFNDLNGIKCDNDY